MAAKGDKMRNVGDSIISGTVEYYFADQLPHGSGIDCKWEYYKTGDYVYFSNSYHCMSEHGYYDGYQDFRIRIDKTLFSYLCEAIVKMNAYQHEPSRQRMIKRVGVLLDIIKDDFTLQFTGSRYKAEKYFLYDYLVDTIAYSFDDMQF